MATKPGLNLAVVAWICPSHEVICRTISFFNQTAVRVDSRAVVLLFGLLLAQPQDVLQPVKSHLHNLGVHHCQQITQGLDAAQVHQVSA